ncbi:MAG: lysophospholipid acyltransferase family protein, partial [Myxococcota bacterium]|nr:lysophospholipid acyltransferase family protein [Myxococcota bacterium]
MHVDYRYPRRTHITVEGLEHVLDTGPCFLAMNHTDRYNYWPFQCQMHQHGRYTTTWVKAKYYNNPFMRYFFDLMSQIPLASRGYVIATAWQQAGMGPLDAPTYRALRDVVDGGAGIEHALARGEAVARFVQLHGGQAFGAEMQARFLGLMQEVMRLNRQALEVGLYVLVFPQGTRSLRLSRGHTGLMQVAQHLGVPIVPIGCSGSDRVYPGNLPFARGGRIVYRCGRPLTPQDPALRPHWVHEPFTPLTRDATTQHGPAFQAATDVLMDRINALLDPPYRYAADMASDGVVGVDRFL